VGPGRGGGAAGPPPPRSSVTRSGALIGPAQQYFAYRFGASQLYLLAYAALFLLVIYLLPEGIVPSLARRLGRLRTGSGPGTAAHEQVATGSIFSAGDLG
jgi:hypothetical protein